VRKIIVENNGRTESCYLERIGVLEDDLEAWKRERLQNERERVEGLRDALRSGASLRRRLWEKRAVWLMMGKMKMM
jgi:hypothetical protein